MNTHTNKNRSGNNKQYINEKLRLFLNRAAGALPENNKRIKKDTR